MYVKVRLYYIILSVTTFYPILLELIGACLYLNPTTLLFLRKLFLFFAPFDSCKIAQKCFFLGFWSQIGDILQSLQTAIVNSDIIL